MVCRGTVVVSSVDFELAETMVRVVGASCARKGSEAPDMAIKTPTTTALYIPRCKSPAILRIFMILSRFPFRACTYMTAAASERFKGGEENSQLCFQGMMLSNP